MLCAAARIDLFYQPQLTAQEKVHGVEPWLRWKHPVAGYIAPPVIIGLAYESGILNELSYYLLNRACKRRPGDPEIYRKRDFPILQYFVKADGGREIF